MGNKIAVYLISLEKDTERRKDISIKLNGIEYIPDYIYAIDGTILNKDILKKKNILVNDNLKKGEIGCYLSHIHMLQKASISNNDYVLIIEDDVGEIELNLVNKYIDSAPKDFELLFLGYNFHKKRENFEFESTSEVWGSHCYVVNVKNISQEKIETLYPIESPIDLVLGDKFKSYVIKPSQIGLNKKYSKYSNTQNIN